jgi:uncharacterized protein YecT (DUF1311 family)
VTRRFSPKWGEATGQLFFTSPPIRSIVNAVSNNRHRMRPLLITTLLFFPAIAFAQEKNECWQQNGGHIAQVDCAIKTLNGLQEQLEHLYTQKLATARIMDAKMKAANEPALANKEAQLKESQESFKDYMASECARQLGYNHNGAMTADIETACKTELILSRLATLEKGD